jgi:hypothetical protein
MRIGRINAPYREIVRWFEEKGAVDVAKAGNAPELLWRIQKLEEGSLRYHLSRFESQRPPVAEEELLYAEFAQWAERRNQDPS